MHSRPVCRSNCGDTINGPSDGRSRVTVLILTDSVSHVGVSALIAAIESIRAPPVTHATARVVGGSRSAIGDDQPHAGEAALDQAAQERAPESFLLCLADGERDHLAVADSCTAYADKRLPQRAASTADLLDLGVQPHSSTRREAELQRLARHPWIAPTRILAPQAQHELSHAIADGRRAWDFARAASTSTVEEGAIGEGRQHPLMLPGAHHRDAGTPGTVH